MKNLSTLLLSMIVYTLTGYLLGMVIGFTLFDPNLDVYALLGVVLAILGVIVSVIPFFRNRANIAMGVLLGFYLGTLLAILLWGQTATDDLLTILQRGGISLVCVTALSIIGGFIGSRLNTATIARPAVALLLGGFVGGFIFVSLGIAPRLSMIGLAPYVMGNGIVTSAIVWNVQQRLKRRVSATPAQN